MELINKEKIDKIFCYSKNNLVKIKHSKEILNKKSGLCLNNEIINLKKLNENIKYLKKIKKFDQEVDYLDTIVDFNDKFKYQNYLFDKIKNFKLKNEYLDNINTKLEYKKKELNILFFDSLSKEFFEEIKIKEFLNFSNLNFEYIKDSSSLKKFIKSNNIIILNYLDHLFKNKTEFYNSKKFVIISKYKDIIKNYLNKDEIYNKLIELLEKESDSFITLINKFFWDFDDKDISNNKESNYLILDKTDINFCDCLINIFVVNNINLLFKLHNLDDNFLEKFYFQILNNMKLFLYKLFKIKEKRYIEDDNFKNLLIKKKKLKCYNLFYILLKLKNIFNTINKKFKKDIITNINEFYLLDIEKKLLNQLEKIYLNKISKDNILTINLIDIKFDQFVIYTEVLNIIYYKEPLEIILNNMNNLFKTLLKDLSQLNTNYNIIFLKDLEKYFKLNHNFFLLKPKVLFFNEDFNFINKVLIELNFKQEIWKFENFTTKLNYLCLIFAKLDEFYDIITNKLKDSINNINKSLIIDIFNIDFKEEILFDYIFKYYKIENKNKIVELFKELFENGNILMEIKNSFQYEIELICYYSINIWVYHNQNKSIKSLDIFNNIFELLNWIINISKLIINNLNPTVYELLIINFINFFYEFLKKVILNDTNKISIQNLKLIKNHLCNLNATLFIDIIKSNHKELKNIINLLTIKDYEKFKKYVEININILTPSSVRIPYNKNFSLYGKENLDYLLLKFN